MKKMIREFGEWSWIQRLPRTVHEGIGLRVEEFGEFEMENATGIFRSEISRENDVTKAGVEECQDVVV